MIGPLPLPSTHGRGQLITGCLFGEKRALIVDIAPCLPADVLTVGSVIVVESVQYPVTGRLRKVPGETGRWVL